jgi:hypothetical protein
MLWAKGLMKRMKKDTGTEIDFPTLRRVLYIGISLLRVKGGTVCSSSEMGIKDIEKCGHDTSEFSDFCYVEALCYSGLRVKNRR